MSNHIQRDTDARPTARDCRSAGTYLYGCDWTYAPPLNSPPSSHSREAPGYILLGVLSLYLKMGSSETSLGDHLLSPQNFPPSRLIGHVLIVGEFFSIFDTQENHLRE